MKMIVRLAVLAMFIVVVAAFIKNFPIVTRGITMAALMENINE